MNEFKVGNEVWFFCTSYGRRHWGDEETVIYPPETELEHGVIVSINNRKDTMHIYVEESTLIVEFGVSYPYTWIFKSKQAAIDAMTKRLDELKDD